jgi:hypothetical protein
MPPAFLLVLIKDREGQVRPAAVTRQARQLATPLRTEQGSALSG